MKYVSLASLFAMGLVVGPCQGQDSAFQDHLRQGQRALRLAKPREAIDHFSLALAAEPDSAVAYALRAEAYRMKNEGDSSIADLSQAMRLDPTNPDYVYRRGCERRRLGLLDWALADFDRAFELDSGAPAAHYGRALCLGMKGDKSRAIKAFEKYLSMEHDDYAQLFLAAISGRLEGLAEVEGPWTSLLAQYLKDEITELQLIGAADEAEDPSGVQERLCEAYAFMGIRAERLGQKARAREHYRAALKTGVFRFDEYAWADYRLQKLEPRGPSGESFAVD